MIDLLVIGAGGAGLSAALAAKEAGASVLVIGKTSPASAQTSMAQGGINAALGNAGEDRLAMHIEDTIASAHGLCNTDMVRKMCQGAPEAITWLERLGVPFSRIDTAQKSPTASVAQRRLGGASAKRACYAQDYTGLKILHTLYDNCLKAHIEIFDNRYLLNLVTEEGIAKGATFFNIHTGEIEQINAKSLVLATGGYGSLYHGFTTNAYGSSGDGISAVLRAGGAVSDMEFVQFHPTALRESSILISESARGEGGYLVNGEGERFIDELKPRDEVARAIFRELADGKEVFLDVRHLGEAKLMALLPQEIALCKLHAGVDPVRSLIPVKPVAHYSMGGIDVDEVLEVNGIKGCFAAGECSNAKVHGANRLGGNSLLEIIVFGRVAGENACQYALCASSKPAEKTQLQKDTEYIAEIYRRTNHINFYETRRRLGELFYEKVGIVRENRSLQQALDEVISMQLALSETGIADKAKQHNQNLVEFLEFTNALLLAPTVISSALARDESRGAHFKRGFEQEDEAFKKHMVLRWKEENR